MTPTELDTGPPKMRRPGDIPGQREMSIFEPTIDVYTSGSQLSSPLVRLACAALSRRSCPSGWHVDISHSGRTSHVLRP
jgi:hypothetical protein